jgi:hypothetical protein
MLKACYLAISFFKSNHHAKAKNTPIKIILITIEIKIFDIKLFIIKPSRHNITDTII